MISTKVKPKKMTPEERKEKVAELRREHQKFFSSHERLDKDNLDDALYIPKMAYRPSGKDELYVSFFPSELKKGRDIYTEFVSIDYDSEDPKRTLYMWEHNKHWEEEYELITSSNGFERHIIPVAELKVINDVNSRNKKEKQETFNFEDLVDPDSKAQQAGDIMHVLLKIESHLGRIADQLTIIKNTR